MRTRKEEKSDVDKKESFFAVGWKLLLYVNPTQNLSFKIAEYEALNAISITEAKLT